MKKFFTILSLLLISLIPFNGICQNPKFNISLLNEKVNAGVLVIFNPLSSKGLDRYDVRVDGLTQSTPCGQNGVTTNPAIYVTERNREQFDTCNRNIKLSHNVVPITNRFDTMWISINAGFGSDTSLPVPDGNYKLSFHSFYDIKSSHVLVLRDNLTNIETLIERDYEYAFSVSGPIGRTNRFRLFYKVDTTSVFDLNLNLVKVVNPELERSGCHVRLRNGRSIGFDNVDTRVRNNNQIITRDTAIRVVTHSNLAINYIDFPVDSVELPVHINVRDAIGVPYEFTSNITQDFLDGFDVYLKDSANFRYPIRRGLDTSSIVTFNRAGVHSDYKLIIKKRNSQNRPFVNNWSLYPNPSSDFIRMDCEVVSKSTMTVYSPVGGLMKTYPLETGSNLLELNVKGYPRGIYTVYIKDGNSTISKKISIY